MLVCEAESSSWSRLSSGYRVPGHRFGIAYRALASNGTDLNYEEV